MTIVYYKGIFEKAFCELQDAINYVNKRLEDDWSLNENDFSYWI